MLAFLKSYFLRSTADPAEDGVVLQVEIEQETDGRWIADIPDLPGVMAYGGTQDEAFQKVAGLALRVLADRIEHEAPRTSRAKTLTISMPRVCLASH